MIVNLQKKEKTRRFRFYRRVDLSGKIAVVTGGYCENNDIASIVDSDPKDPLSGADSRRNFGVLPHAVDPQAAERLWILSERLVFGDEKWGF